MAVLVASGLSPSDVFDAVSAEAGAVLDAESAGVFRFYDDGGTVAVSVGRWGDRVDEFVPVGMVLRLTGAGAIAEVGRTGKAARVDDYAGLEGPTAEHARRTGLRGAVAAPILIDGRVWGALALATFRREPFPSWAETRLDQFAELVSLAIAAADAHERLLESRRRLVLSADTERRRIERNLHDGAQQRLVSLAITLRLARDNIVFAPEHALSTIDAASEELSQALVELRELARGLHPSILSERGLEPALRSLADKAPVPVDVTIGFAERLPEAVEAAAYFVVAEALTNAAKYAQASAVTVHLSSRDQAVLVRCRMTESEAPTSRPARDSVDSQTVSKHSPVESTSSPARAEHASPQNCPSGRRDDLTVAHGDVAVLLRNGAANAAGRSALRSGGAFVRCCRFKH